MPRGLPTQRFPSRSSKSAVAGPPVAGTSLAKRETPLLVKHRSPLFVPTQVFDSRYRIMESTSICRRDDGTRARVRSVPFQRHTPLLVPTHNSEFSSGRRQLTFIWRKSFVAA